MWPDMSRDRLRIIDESGKEVEVGRPGELVAGRECDARLLESIRKRLRPHFETECFVRETSAIKMRTDIFTFSTVSRT